MPPNARLPGSGEAELPKIGKVSEQLVDQISQQTHEIGVRIALGAPRGRVMGVIFRRGMLATGVGLALGMVPAFGLARLLAFALWGVNAAGPGTFIGIPLALAAALAIYVPARRAVGIDPMVALREE